VRSGTAARFLSLLLLLAAPTAYAQDNYRGIWLSTAYPALSVPADRPVALEVSVNSKNVPPQRVDLTLSKAPTGWTGSLLGKSGPVTAVFLGPDGKADVNLRLDPPQGLPNGNYDFTLSAKGEGYTAELPVTLTIGSSAPPRLTMSTELPSIKGSPTSTFKFRTKIENFSAREALVQLAADAPPGFRISFTEAFGARELTSLPVPAGGNKEIDVGVEVPRDTPSGTYAITARGQAEGVQAVQQMSLEIAGRPTLSVSGPDARVSGGAVAGEETPIEVVIKNTGNAPATNISVSSSPPSGWKIAFAPNRIPELPAGGEAKVSALVTPSPRAIAGDYMVNVSANGESVLSSQDFRISVRTSTVWGIIAIAIIAAAVVILGLAVVRYGRR
jgi:uncharacterized membrane protein